VGILPTHGTAEAIAAQEASAKPLIAERSG
jgi:hypothetical protein